MDVYDINGKELKIGQKITYGDTTSTHNAIICIAEITDIIYKHLETWVKARILKTGDHLNYYIGKERLFRFPRNYDNICII